MVVSYQGELGSRYTHLKGAAYTLLQAPAHIKARVSGVKTGSGQNVCKKAT